MTIDTEKSKFVFIKKILIIILLSIILALIASLVIISHKVHSPNNSSAENTTLVPEPTIRSVSSNILFSGNTYWGRYINEWSMASPLKYAYPFSRLNEFGRENYDAWISGLECPLVSGLNLTAAQEEENLSFNCSPEYLAEASKWFTAFTLANNHTDNQGDDGFIETQQNLDKHSIQYFGHHDPYLTDEICEIISLPVKTTMSNNEIITGNLPVAMCGYNAVFKLPKADSIEVTKKYSQYMPVFAMPHMGLEYKSSPDQLKIDFYHDLIDAGVDAVIADHPHWIQNSESYNGRLIIYSMGNFIFDQQGSSEQTRSAAIGLKLSLQDGDLPTLKEWLLIGDECKIYKDKCLEKIEALGLKKLNPTFEFYIVGSDSSNKITKPASADLNTQILQRLKWTETIRGLKYPYSGI